MTGIPVVGAALPAAVGGPVPASWRRSIYPRRGGARVAYAPAPGEVPDWAVTRAVLEDPDTDPRAAAAGLAMLDGTETPFGAAAIGAALDSAVIDEWIVRFGLPFAAIATVEFLSLRGARRQCSMDHRHVRECGDRPCDGHRFVARGGHGSWPDAARILSPVRAAVAAATDDVHAEVVEALLPYREGTLRRRVATSFLDPSQTAWVEADSVELAGLGRPDDLACLLLAAVHTHEQARRVHGCLTGDAYWRLRSPVLMHTVAEGVGDGILDAYAGWWRLRQVTAADRLALLKTLAAVPSDRAFQEMLGQLDVRGAQAAVESAAERFPERAMRLLTASADRPLVAELLRRHALRHPTLVPSSLPADPAATASADASSSPGSVAALAGAGSPAGPVAAVADAGSPAGPVVALVGIGSSATSAAGAGSSSGPVAALAGAGSSDESVAAAASAGSSTPVGVDPGIAVAGVAAAAGATEAARLVVPASWRRSIHPRRGGIRVAYAPVAETLPAWPDTSTALRLSPAAALADAAPDTPLGAAAAAAILLWTPRVPTFDPRAIADHWIAGAGLKFAAAAGIELAGLRPLTVRCDAPTCPGRHTTVTHRADEADAHNGTGGVETVLAQLRVALAAASDDLHATVVESLSDLRAGMPSRQLAESGGRDVPAVESLRESRAGTLARRIAASFLAPDQTAWVDEDARELAADGRRHPHAPLLMAAAHTPAQAALIRPQIHSVGWRLLRGTAMIHTVGEGLGDGVLDVYAGWHRSDWGTADEQRVLMTTLAAVPTDRAFQALLDALDIRGAQSAVETAAERFPERAMRLLSSASRAGQLATAPAASSHPAAEAVVSDSSAATTAVSGSSATVAAGSGSSAVSAAVSESPGTIAAGSGIPGTVAVVSGSSAAADQLAAAAAQRGARIAELLRRHAVRHPGLVPAVADGARAANGGLTEAGRVALPAVLVTPPWEVRRAVVKPVVVPGLRCDDEPAVVWPPGEREQLVARLKRSVYRNDPEQLASQLRAGSLEDWLAVDLFEAGPEDLVRPLLATWEPKRLWGAHYWLRLIAARFGVAALPLVLRVARRSPADGGPALLAYAGPEVAVLVAGWHGRLKAARAVALEWLRRHPRAAARALVPPALGKQGVGRRHAELALLALAAAGHRDTVLDVAGGYGPRAGDAIRDLLDTDPLDVLPARIPFAPAWADPATLPPVRPRGGAHVLPADAAGHLVTMLMVSRGDDPYAGIPIVRDACEPADLARFAWALLERWERADAPTADGWVLDAQALLGDDETAVRLAAAVRDWPYQGAHQRAAAGLDMLAQLGTDAALTQLQDIAAKVKAKAVRARAELKLREVAEALDLTPDQLADRLVPHLDLSPDATLTLDYGPRGFVGGFDEQLRPYVIDEAGTRRKDLPAPAAGDDPRLAPVAQQRFAAAKKAVRKVAGEQAHRLERAMVMRREWTGAEFRRTFLQHPLLWQIARRLVWLVTHGGVDVAVRLAEDRTLADAGDGPVLLADDAVVSVAHPVHLDVPKWSEVFADYEILQPFRQLARDVHALTAQEGSATRLDRFDGRKALTVKLLSLERRGWRRTGQDGGHQGRIERDLPAGPGLPGGGTLIADLDPGIMMGVPGEHPEQSLEIWIRPAGGAQWSSERTVPFSALDPVSASEILRDLGGCH
ncbi:DUF4132 domain-containing protein [Dactylosporangium sp. NPDC049742]|uniref:DUF4132 domain-containing protein n=1 Tax=Dactylosporangium sp. NPDC049742 TaxID=3154737 RepID=UPI00341C67DF